MPAHLRGTGTTRRIDKTKGINATTDDAPTGQGQRDNCIEVEIKLIKISQ
jgi:hypothetical protein